MATDHPFQMLFETFGRMPLAHAESVNRRAHLMLVDLLSVPLERSGRCILLRAPRAGHGKTHLLSRVHHEFQDTHEFIPLRATCGYQVGASTVIEDTLRHFMHLVPNSTGMSLLDQVTRRLFASALQPLVSSGEVPCQDRQGALDALKTRPLETFDFHHPTAVTAHWTQENFGVLGERLSAQLARQCNLPIRDVAFWVESLFRFASAPVDQPNRHRLLVESVHAGDASESARMGRLEALLGLLTLLKRVVLVADDLEGLSSDANAALRLATFVGSLRQAVDRVDVIISLNKDVWEGVFLPCLSGGLADRMAEAVVDLEALTADDWLALLECRAPGMGKSVLQHLDLGVAGTHARAVVRAAGEVWLNHLSKISSACAASSAVPDQGKTADHPAILSSLESVKSLFQQLRERHGGHSS